MRTECERFFAGSSMRAICEGTENMSLDRINAYRVRHWRMEPLTEAEVTPYVPPPAKLRREPQRANGSTAKRGGGCGGGCGGKSKKTPRLNGYGPGSRLTTIMEEAGIPHCPACLELAAKMDQWGKADCTKKLDQIVADILPRAREWLTENKPIVHKFLSVVAIVEDLALKKAIRGKVLQAIDSATERPPPRKRKPRAKKETYNPGDKSNLLESTAGGNPTWEKGTHPTVERIPFVGEPVRNLIYHVYPLRGSDVWRWNVDMILERIDLFNGRRVVAIAVGDETESAEAVKDRFGSEVVEYMVFKNNKHAGEMSSFVPLLAQVESDDPNQVTFRAHAKCVVRCGKEKSPHFRDWVEMLYRTSLEDWPLVQQHLESAAMTGSCRKFGQFNKRKLANRPTYSGTFYWFRNCFVYSRDWQVVDTPRWGCESWPGKMFAKDETRCICLDNTGSMYSQAYWESTVRPAYETWLKERGLSR